MSDHLERASGPRRMIRMAVARAAQLPSAKSDHETQCQPAAGARTACPFEDEQADSLSA